MGKLYSAYIFFSLKQNVNVTNIIRIIGIKNKNHNPIVKMIGILIIF